ncbi:AAA family ATPase [Candidatus Pacearchaeota archaeon]|nr:AAA family ATPase [Candidatus Pacearchaeota archaeon]
MLLNLEIENFKSFKEKQIFSMEANLKDETLKENYFSFNGNNILKSSIIFGANASGKTNLIKSLGYLKSLVITSKTFDEKQDISREYFKLDEDYFNNKPFSIKVEFIENKKKYIYEVSLKHIDKKEGYKFIILKENLFENGDYIFKRSEKEGININDKFISEGDEVIKELAKKINKNNLFLSNLSTKEFSGISNDAFNWFSDRLVIQSGSINGLRMDYTKNQIEINSKFKEFLFKHIKLTDLGNIENLSVEEESPQNHHDFIKMIEKQDSIPNDVKKQIIKNQLLKLKTYHKNKEGKKIKFDFNNEESDGTKKFIGLLGPIYDIITNNKVFFVDELEESLHPNLLKYIFEIVQNSKSTSQIVSTSHSYPLLLYVNSNDEIFRRDQIWFTNRKKDCSTELYSLVNVGGIRKDLRIFKAYFEGRFEAFPDIK